MKIDKKKISKILMKILNILLKFEAIFFNILKFLIKGSVLLASFILLFSLYLSLSDYLSKKENQLGFFRGIFVLLGFLADYIINMIPVTSFLNYKLDKIINRIQNLNNRVKKINTNIFFFIKILFVAPIFLMVSICRMIFGYKIFDFLKDELGLKVKNIFYIELILKTYIFPLIYVLVLTYLLKKFLTFYYKKKSLKKS